MAILKGQNFRVLTYDSTASKFKCVGMATNCTVTLNGNTEDASTKDDVGMSAKPTVVSKSWQVQVESLNVADAGAMLTAIKSLTPFTLLWDEVSTTDNQTPEEAAFSRTGTAYLSDITFNFNDRENSSKSLQFTGSGPLAAVTETPAFASIATGSYTKGQYVRLFLGSDNSATPAKVIAAAKQLSLHVSMSVEDATTKDTTGDWQVQEPVGLSYDISTSALMRGGDTISSSVDGQTISDVMAIYESSDPVKFQIANVSGDNNRTKGAVIVSGSVVITSLTLNGPNRQNADYSAQLNGYGAYTVGA
jgi:predicted secreted protein